MDEYIVGKFEFNLTIIRTANITITNAQQQLNKLSALYLIGDPPDCVA